MNKNTLEPLVWSTPPYSGFPGIEDKDCRNQWARTVERTFWNSLDKSPTEVQDIFKERDGILNIFYTRIGYRLLFICNKGEL